MKTNTDKHTPGPWSVCPGLTIYAPAPANVRPLVAKVIYGGEADARLIAAAPDLLAALENIIETAPIDIECEDSVEKYRSFVLRVACAAHAQVEGGAK